MKPQTVEKEVVKLVEVVKPCKLPVEQASPLRLTTRGAKTSASFQTAKCAFLHQAVFRQFWPRKHKIAEIRRCSIPGQPGKPSFDTKSSG